MQKFPYSFVTTVLNEEKTIKNLIESLFAQTLKPQEIIVVDAGSSDGTIRILKKYKSKLRILIKKGNRSVGRNFGIRNAKNQIILISDAGCVLQEKWAENIVKPFMNKEVNVVGGFYKPVVKNIFEKSLAAYTSTMPDKVDPKTFLPASRSIAFKRNAWSKVGGYPEYLDTCEDLVFDRKLQKAGFRFAFARNAIVLWPQRSNIFEAFKQFYVYAVGDGMARYIRWQTPFLFFRCIFALILILLYLYTRSEVLLAIVFSLAILYTLWAIKKNYRYVHSVKALYYLPALQIISDIAVFLGTSIGFIKSFMYERA